MGADELESAKMSQSKETLRQLIAQWNANRLDLFEISEPAEDGEFHGVMRFYFQEAGAKVATKCIRVASSATAKAVIETLVEKFRPDMRMLSIPQYALYEIHENGEERRLEDEERPLLVQLNWHSDDREGRFLLRRIDEKPLGLFGDLMNKVQDIAFGDSFKRKLSKREKKQLKKLQEKTKSEASSVAEKLYTELPESGFTRSISNPEAVMRRRRQQKLEKKLAQFRSRDGGPDTGGTLKIYGESLCRDVPYKTLLLSVSDAAAYVVKEMLAKYSLTNYDPQQYCLVQVCEGEGEYILDDDESPLSILMNQPSNRGSIMFHVRRRPPDFHPRKRKKKPGRRADDELGSGYRGSYDGQIEPLLIELLPDGSETGRRVTLESDVTEVGSDWGGLQLAGLRPRHCVIANTEGIVTLTPSSRDADIYVNGQRIYETTMLQHGTIIRFGRTHYFRFAQRGRPFSEREVAEPSPSQLANQSAITGGNVTQSPPMSPSSEEIPRAIRSDSILPATLELPEAGEEGFLAATIVNVTPTTLQFKLAPTYALYLAARYRATTHFRPEATPHERAHLLSAFLLRVAHILMQTIQERNSDGNYLAFWMANASELLHFLKSDRQIGAFSLDAQDVLAEVVQLGFRHLVTCVQAELASLIGNFLLERDEDDEKATTPILGVLGTAMTLLRRCRVNAALTIQLFSQLFHFINMAVFNKVIGMDGGRNYCSRVWGNRLRRRLNRIETWAEKQGLELAADCHLVRVVQAAHLLQAPKSTPEELATTASSCFKLNSLQLRCLLMKYQYETDEVPIPSEMLDNIIRVAESTVDEVIRTDGRHVRVEEEPLLGLAFLLPEDGYSCDIVRGVPSGLIEFLSPLAPLCRLTPNPSAAGYWTIFFQDPMRSPSAMSGRSFAPAFNNSTTTPNHQHVLQPQQPPQQNPQHLQLPFNNHLSSATGASSMHGSSLNPVSSGGGGSGGGPVGNGNVGGGSGGVSNNNTNNSDNPMMSSVTGLGSPTTGGGTSSQSILNNNTHSSASVVNNVMMGGGNRASNLAGEPEIQTIKLQKLNSGLGLSIVAAKGVGQDRLGIYIKSVVTGGSADMDGRLAAGDQLLSVDGQSLVAITQEKAAEFLVRTGPVVTLEVAKQAAIFQGLATMLSQPSPVMTRDSSNSYLDSAFYGSNTSGGINWGMMRPSHSDSSLTRWKSFEALSRRGLSESALGTTRVVGTSRLLKFFQHPFDNNLLYSTSTSSSPCGPQMSQSRRMSERDLPSKVLREQNAQDMESHGHGHGHHGSILQPRIHSSKSVPSLNSERDHLPIPMSQSSVGPGMLSPGNANNPSGHSGIQPVIRSPGYHNHNHGHHGSHGHGLGLGSVGMGQEQQQNPRYPPQNYPSMSMTMQPQSKSHQQQDSLHSSAHRSRSIQSLADPPHRPDIGNKQPSTPSLHLQGQGEDERYYQNVGFYPPPPPPPNPANMPLRTYIPYSNSVGNIPAGSHLSASGNSSSSMHAFRPGPGGSMSYRGPPPNLNTSMPVQGNLNWQRGQPGSGPGPGPGGMIMGGPQHGGFGLQRDLMRQEAKMLEMQDELRRREERAALMMTKAQQQERHQQNRYNPRFTYTPGQPGPHQTQQMLQQQRAMSSGGGMGMGGGPPTVPSKPYRPDSIHGHGQDGGTSGIGGPGRPPLPDEYKFSSGELPRGGFTFNNANGLSGKQLLGNPWDSAEKEREVLRRKEAARFWREQQIHELENLPARNPAQDEQLRALRLEREFQRRAEEARREDDGEGEEEEEEEDERKAMVRRVQEDLERTRIHSGSSISMSNGNKLDPMGEERARKMEEIRRKKLELEAAQAAEERLVREATKRREEELRRQHSQMLQHQQHMQMQQQQQQQQQQRQQEQQQQLQQQQQQQSYRTPYSGTKGQGSQGPSSVDGMSSQTNALAPPLPKSPPPALYRPTTLMNSNDTMSATQALQQQQQHQQQQQSASSPQKSPVTPPETSPRPKSDKKSVSFNETVATNEPSSPVADSPPTERVREDPNQFFSDATAMLSSPRSPDGLGPGGLGNTPGVIGAQEVYRDPRWRRLAEQQQKQQAANAPKPEKLTFKEKMKMFAMESGEDSTPKDKVKVSKAQREIETFPSTPTSAK